MKKVDTTNVVASNGNANADIKRIVPGAYMFHILKVEDDEARGQLVLTMDVSEGEYKNYGANCESAFGNDWSYIKLYAKYDGNARLLSAWVRFLDRLQDCNKKFNRAVWESAKELDEQKFVGLEIGVVLDEDDYNDKYRIKPNYFKTLNREELSGGKFKVKYLTAERKQELRDILADKKRATETTSVPFSAMSDDVCPF